MHARGNNEPWLILIAKLVGRRNDFSFEAVEFGMMYGTYFGSNVWFGFLRTPSMPCSVAGKVGFRVLTSAPVECPLRLSTGTANTVLMLTVCDIR